MNCTIDIGNTKTKVAFFNEKLLIDTKEVKSNKELFQLLTSLDIDETVLTSVKKLDKEFVNNLKKITKLLILNARVSLPIKNLYKTPNTLGSDRLAGVIGANVLFPSRACLVIDAGTCITYDIIDKNKNYHGGNISPGLNMRFKALHHYTSKLPHIEQWQKKENSLIGKSTEEAIINGVINGLVHEIEGTINSFEKKFEQIKVLLCGGDRFFFETRIKEHIFVASNLIHIGLNEILLYNKKTN